MNVVYAPCCFRFLSCYQWYNFFFMNCMVGMDFQFFVLTLLEAKLQYKLTLTLCDWLITKYT